MKTPRLLLVRPPDSMGLLGAQIIHEPLNILTLAAVARQSGADVRIADFALELYSEQNFQRLLQGWAPDIVGFSCMTQDVHSAAELAQFVHQALPKTVTLAGGIHPSALPEGTVDEFPAFDAIVAGEGEGPLAAMVERSKKLAAPIDNGELFEGIAGVYYKQGKIVVSQPPAAPMADLGVLPLPARDLAPTEKYFSRTSTPGVSGLISRVGTLFTARGCPYQCIFCSGSLICGQRPRTVPPNLIALEVKDLVERYGAQHITVKDDTFTLDADHTLKVGAILSDAGVTWDCKTRINVADKSLLAEMKKQGCVRLHFGVESGSDRILKLIKKNTTVEQIENAFAVAGELGFDRTAYFIIGAHPSETHEEFAQSRALCKRLRPEYAVFSVVVPYPGTELNRIMKTNGQVLSEDWRRYNPFVQVPAWRTDHFSPEQLMSMQKSAMTRYYLSPHFIASKLKTLRYPSAWKYWARSASDFFKYRKTR